MRSTLQKEIRALVTTSFYDEPIAKEYLRRLIQGKLTRDENELSHFCIYFVPYDSRLREIFIGHHKKANLWLANGGHIDEGETLEETVLREIGEEWGIVMDKKTIGTPKLLTITPIDNQQKQTCRIHFDIWYFIPVDKKLFHPDPEKLLIEFYETKWVKFDDARKIITDKATQIAREKIADMC